MGSQTSGGLVKTAIQLSQEQDGRVKALARERQVSRSAVIRDALRDYLVAIDTAVTERQKEAVAA